VNIYVRDIEIHGHIDMDRAMVKVDVVHRVSGKVIGSGMIPIWCSGFECEGCAESHEKGEG